MTATAALRAGAIAVTQRPFEYLTADVVLSEGPRRNKWRVRLGPHDAALVWGDEMAEALRPFGLYWTDGPREWVVRGNPEHPDELVNLARSIYC